ncbi:hypothetical protein Clacol_008313 [Clathrus columnatus]|uniref:Alpha/beta hydrolase n=1 Tax=Clathrus columnatus TaxID=1419009 RepID=A0AAV5AHD0_9AGAM|nr:hypothetical protein Clacol_008313 [Clathrus columnatus]
MSDRSHFQGNKDTIVPISSGEKIKAIIGSAEFVTVNDAGHDLVFSQNGGFEQLEESVLGFLKD